MRRYRSTRMSHSHPRNGIQRAKRMAFGSSLKHDRFCRPSHHGLGGKRSVCMMTHDRNASGTLGSMNEIYFTDDNVLKRYEG